MPLKQSFNQGQGKRKKKEKTFLRIEKGALKTKETQEGQLITLASKPSAKRKNHKDRLVKSQN